LRPPEPAFRALGRSSVQEESGVELLSRLNWVDLAIILILAGGVFVGFTQGMIRYVLNAVAVLVAFVLAAQLKGPILDLLRFWTAFTPEGRELLVFVLLFFGFVIAGSAARYSASYSRPWSSASSWWCTTASSVAAARPAAGSPATTTP
jgi:hypothetical protein